MPLWLNRDPRVFHRQFHTGQALICGVDRELWPCSLVRAHRHRLEVLSERCQYLCPWCHQFVWMSMQDGEMWCSNPKCSYYASQFELLYLVFDPSLADIQVDMLELS